MKPIFKINRFKKIDIFSFLFTITISFFLLKGIFSGFNANSNDALSLYIMFFIYYKRYKNPTVTKLAKEPKALLTLSESQLKEAKQKLETINRLESTLKEAEVSQEQFEKTLEFYESQEEQKAQLFAQHIEAKECKKEGEFYRIKMSEDFRLDALKSFLLYISDESSSKIEKEVTALNDKVFVLANEEQQNAVAKLAHDKTNRVITPRVEELTELMLSDEPQDKFVKILSNCLLAKDVSPYQLNGDVKSESNFFGRVEILREIISNDEVNYLIVGARQLGKSSILKALERRYAKSAKVVCYSFTLDESGELLPSMAESLGLEKSATLEQIVLAIKEQEKRPIFLIDEADMFVKHEKERGYLITSVLRKLSQEGEATFVMAGFWTLYEYVTLDYQSPLKNFGKLITLGGLEEEACQQLMVEPMKRIGISYESEQLVEETVKRCGYRANYIATVCDVVLRKLEGSVIEKDAVEDALESEAIDKMLKGWGSLSANREANRLDRLIVYLTLEKESFRLGDVVEGLEKYGLNIDIERVNESLDRLVLGYVLGKHKGNYAYQIPLLKERILEDDLDYLIDGEVNGLKSK